MRLSLTMSVTPGSNIDAAAACAQQIADKTDSNVEFQFNSIRCVARPGGSADIIANLYDEARNSELVVYSDLETFCVKTRGDA